MRVLTDDRCRLQSRDLFKPRTRYDAQVDERGRVILTELVPKAGAARFTSTEQVIRAIETSPLNFKRSWAEMSQELREP